MTTAEFFLPWPDRRLSPNAREHWACVARAKKRAKLCAYYSAKEAGLGKIEADSLSVRYAIYPPDRRARDQDNIIASLKAYADGIAEAIGIDDSKWNISIAPRGPIEKGGMIKVELDWSAA
jgi:crossover junction endodeoxyribonuclease RusA